MPEADISWISVWLLGVSLGLTACTVTCLPFIGTWVLGRDSNAGGVWRDAVAFLGGRLLAYGALGGLAGALGTWFVRELAGGWGNAAIGLAAIAAGLVLAAPTAARPACRVRPLADRLSPLLLGVALTLIPCAPLATLLAACAGAGSAWQGWLLGSIFGLGTLLTPMLVFIPAIGGFARRLIERNPWLAAWLRFGAAVVLLLVGARRLVWLDPAAGSAALGLSMAVWALLAIRTRRSRGAGAVNRIAPAIPRTG